MKNKSFRMTKKRKIIYNLLKKADRPLTAIEIFTILTEKEEDIWLSTIYRTLELFKNEGIIVQTELPGSEISHYVFADESHKHYGVCMNCQKVISITDCPLDSYKPKLSDSGFHIIDHRFTVYGYCSTCNIDKKEP